MKWIKRGIILTADIVMTVIAWMGAQWLCSSFILSLSTLTTATLVQCVIFTLCGLYRGVWRFASIPDLIRILRAVLIGTTTLVLFLNLPAQIYITYILLLIILVSAPRLIYRWYRDYSQQIFNQGKRVLVVGAGSAGEGIIRDLRRSPLNKNFKPIAFVDDDPMRLGREVHGVRVVGKSKDIAALVSKLNIELILIAIPSAGSQRMREIVSHCEQSKVPFRTLPNIKDIADGTVSMSSLREILLEDLLGREQVSLDWEAISHTISNKTILVTGGGGSIGAELCRQISHLNPEKLIILDKNEFNIYAIDKELRHNHPAIQLYVHLCSVTDKVEMAKIFDLYQPNVVFHVAAYKHVPLLEKHLRIAMHNNIIGTRIVAELANDYQVNTFVLISTDKAVNPTNIMGATKRASEVFCQNFNLHSATKFITVRFGNVLESSGSVIPLFRKQLLDGGPLTVTHPGISRYFMTIPEASLLILQAATMNEHGEIFILDMGNPIKIRYLAEQMIKLSGKVVGKDIQIQYIGLRPGEKLHEELFHENENIGDTSHPKIKRAKTRTFDWQRLIAITNEIELACDSNDELKLKKLLRELVPEYKAREEHKLVPQQDHVDKVRSL